jgi:hypothetical protein
MVITLGKYFLLAQKIYAAAMAPWQKKEQKFGDFFQNA